MDINAQLQLNFHPKDCENMSLVTAKNIKLANDESCIMNEESIIENTFIKNGLDEYFKDSPYKIVSIIPCNTELVIICVRESAPSKGLIFRYREETSNQKEAIKCVYGKTENSYFKYHNGKIKGAFTYNIENSLVLAIAEYDGDEEYIPLRTINLGNFDDETVLSDVECNEKLLAISPEVYIPKMSNIKYVAGRAYKGWYYFFIRYKINSVDYTQWYNFGQPIYIDTIEQFNIVKYCYKQEFNHTLNGGDYFNHEPIVNRALGEILIPKKAEDGYCVGASDYFSNKLDIANESVEFILQWDNNNLYSKYQIGYICATKGYTKCYKSSDIDITTTKYVLDITLSNESSAVEMIANNYNYFDVKNIINYKNKIFIANYKELNNNYKIEQSIIDGINLQLKTKTIRFSGAVYQHTMCKNPSDVPIFTFSDLSNTEYDTIGASSISNMNQYDGTSSWFDLSTYLNVSGDTSVTIGGYCAITKYNNGKYTTEKKDYTLNTVANNVKITNIDSVTQPENTFATIINYPVYNLIQFYIEEKDSSNRSIWYIYTTIYDVKITVNSPLFKEPLIFLHGEYAMFRPVQYTNVSTSFEHRKLSTTLIPGEVYNFFVHFVDKYGHASNGYRLNNNVVWTCAADAKTEIVPISFSYSNTTYYASVPVNEDLLTSDGKLNTKNIRIYTSIENGSSNNPKLTSLATGISISMFSDLFKSFESEKYKNFKWYQLASGYGDINTFLPYYNKNGEKLFRIPVHKIRPIGTTQFLIESSNIQIPDKYVGVYISYEKFEPLKRTTGLFTRNDFRTQDYFKVVGTNSGIDGTNKVMPTANTEKTNSMFFYTDQYDIADTIKLDYNLMRVDGENIFDKYDIPEHIYYQRSNNYKYCVDFNKPQVLDDLEYAPSLYAMPDFKLCVADSAVDGRQGLGTGLQIQDSYGMFPAYRTMGPEDGKPNFKQDDIKVYKVSLFNLTQNLYCSKEKTLIRCSDIVYKSNGKCNIKAENTYFNGVGTYNNFIVYENSGLLFDTTNNVALRSKNNTRYYPEKIDSWLNDYPSNFPFMAYIQMPIIDDHFHESKSFKNEPQNIAYYVYQNKDKSDTEKGNENNKYQYGCIVTPANSTDLFENRQSSSCDLSPKTYSNYLDDLIMTNSYNKTIRQSNPIMDETRVNGWRTFPTELYKNITENKGIITNLVGLGTVLLVHTEHSLFMFDTNNVLQTSDKEVQLGQQEIFDLAYKEVFTSDLGYGGLQDDKSFIVGEFGYIFYNTDFHRIYRFDDNQLVFLDDDIQQWLYKYKPTYIRFGNDKFNNRILMNIKYNVNDSTNNLTLSYNYNSKEFISTHDYYFNVAYNTKNKLYMQCDSKHINCSLHNFVQDDSSYGRFDNIYYKTDTNIRPSKIGIIVNLEYDAIKYLESISYKLNKIYHNITVDYTELPFEQYNKPFSGDLLRVYNNEVDTGSLNISITKEEAKNIFCNYSKPYWDLGMWNYNYFRNKISEYMEYGDAFNMSRLFGNYFIIEFTFLNEDGKRIEFEDLKYNMIK